jgi:hypothetical protein
LGPITDSEPERLILLLFQETLWALCLLEDRLHARSVLRISFALSLSLSL